MMVHATVSVDNFFLLLYLPLKRNLPRHDMHGCYRTVHCSGLLATLAMGGSGFWEATLFFFLFQGKARVLWWRFRLPPDYGQLIFTGRKRSLGQGNVFTGVCLSNGGGCFPACITGHMTRGSASEGSASSSVCIGGADPSAPQDAWETTGYGQQAGSTHPTGMLSC